MKRRHIIGLLLLLTSGVAACRQADATMPSAAQASMDGDVRHVSKDILNVVGKVPEGPKELTDDLVRFCGTPEGEPGTQELARRLVNALQNGSAITPENAQKLAELLWQGIGLRDISERQSKALQDQVKEILVASGVSAQNGDSVAGQLADIHKVINRRPRKWYEVF